MDSPRGWYSRGYLPHIDAGSRAQFLTWRLIDSIPAELLEKWRFELQKEKDDVRKREMYARVEKYLDSGRGSCVLRNPVAAHIVVDTFFKLGDRMKIHAFTVMPNHVHALITPGRGERLGKLVKDIKGASSHAVNVALNRKGTLWAPDYFDRLMRDERHFLGTSKYIEWNPVKARLCVDPKYWSHSSANPLHRERLELVRELAE